MVIEVKRSVGRAKCFICEKKIEVGAIQLVFHTYGNYAKSCHHKCIDDKVEAYKEHGNLEEEANKLLDNK